MERNKSFINDGQVREAVRDWVKANWKPTISVCSIDIHGETIRATAHYEDETQQVLLFGMHPKTIGVHLLEFQNRGQAA